MKVCFFGSYDKNYSKNSVLIAGLKKNGVKIVQSHHPNYFSVFHYTSLLFQFIKNARYCDIIFVAFFGHYDVIYAWLIAKLFGKKLVFDPLVSIYNTRIEDRKYFKKNSLRANLYKLFDSINVVLPDHVFIDTYAQLDYYQKNFHINPQKVSVIRVGADETKLNPVANKPQQPLNLLFYGSYQPSQGVKKIIEAAKILKNENFTWTFIGRGQDRPKVERFAEKNKLKKVTFIDTIPFEDLVRFMNDANIIFGVFGNTPKTKIVIHNKIFQSIAMGRVLITQDTPAVREVISNNQDALLVNPRPSQIAQKILFLKNHPEEIIRISQNARRTYLRNFTSAKVGKDAKEALLKVINISLKISR